MTSRRPSIFRSHSKSAPDDDTSITSSEGVGALKITTGDADPHIHIEAEARVLDDGRVDVKLSQKAFKIAKKLQTQKHFARIEIGEHLTRNNRNYEASLQPILGKYAGVPKLNIAIHIVGSRGDVQPFVSIGQVLTQPPYGHRVRICTHPVFKEFVEENGLEFFSVGGDPATLMAYMVKNPGLMPGRESWKAGDVGKRRADIAGILEGCWRSCFEEGDGMGGERRRGNVDKLTEASDRLFIADAIIANPPSYGHIHCAEKLGIPLHMMFTMPWSPTQYFPHPLASIERNGSDPNLTNYMSYTLMELLAWQGLGDVINNFRLKTLHLDPISPLWGHMLLSRMKVPFTYAWSSSLIPKPPDWGSYINISGFSFLKTGSSYTPPEDLVKFIEAGPPPVYIGFGSIVVDDPNALTTMIFSAVKKAGVRALVSKGWGGIGGGDVPENVYLLGNCPHDWLFQYVSCVVHHGGAGTSAIGIAMGKPTVVVPFFGDQPFWGAMVYRAGAGPEPVPYKKLTADILAKSITRALQPDIQTSVKEMSEKIAGENGSADAAASFHQVLNYDSMRCLLTPERVAVWRVQNTNLRLSGFAAATLIDNGLMKLKDMKLVKHRDWYIDEGASNPLIGAVATVSGTVTNAITSFTAYSHDLSTTLNSPSSTASAPIPGVGSPETENNALNDTNTLAPVPSRFFLDTVVNYPPDHLERVAYSMASNKLPSKYGAVARMGKYNSTPLKPTTRSHTQTSLSTQHSKAHDVTHETESLIVAITVTGLKAPVAFLYNLANGFHNAPSFLLNDATVRRRDNIRGFGSGCKVAGKGFVYNLFDGVAGLVYQPYLGVKKHSSKGFVQGVRGGVRGVGKGLGGLVFKSTAAVLGVPAYTLKGVEKQVEKRFDRGLKAKILEVRLRQGLVAYSQATKEEKEEVLSRWRELGDGARIGGKSTKRSGLIPKTQHRKGDAVQV